ncbi:MAG: patatin-like phospholipase family protein [Caulobacteraceae bacterium]|nr:patatin-like phospholipase family protein [Caulobacteraceae bacterium]
MADQSVSGSARRVLVLQGGGALGSYQAGVYDALQRCGQQIDWVAGISIGAINAALIAGNPPERRVERLKEFWLQVTSGLLPAPPFGGEAPRTVFNEASAALAAAFGVSGFFTPRMPGPLFYPPGAPEALSLYDTAPLRATLERLVDFDRINARETRFSVGAVNIRTGNFTYFDNARQKIGPEHVMASGALPPGFPPVEIDGEHYWDGGLVSNTPLEYVLDEQGKDDLLVFQVDLFSSRGPLPRNLMELAEREKDIRFSSRTRLNTDANLKIRKAKAALRSLIEALPSDLISESHAELLSELAHESAVTVIQLVYRQKPYEGGTRDYEFSRQSMLDHWAAGLENVERYLSRPGRSLDRLVDGESAVFDPGWNPPAGPSSPDPE